MFEMMSNADLKEWQAFQLHCHFFHVLAQEELKGWPLLISFAQTIS